MGRRQRRQKRLPALFLKAGFSASDAAGLFVVCCLGFGFPCQLLHRFQNGVRQCFQLSALVRAHGRGETEPLVEHCHVLKLIVDEFLHEVTGLHRP